MAVAFPLLEGADGVVQKKHRHSPSGQVQVDGRVFRGHSSDEIVEQDPVEGTDMFGGQQVRGKRMGDGIEMEFFQEIEHLVKLSRIIAVSAHHYQNPWFVMPGIQVFSKWQSHFPDGPCHHPGDFCGAMLVQVGVVDPPLRVHVICSGLYNQVKRC